MVGGCKLQEVLGPKCFQRLVVRRELRARGPGLSLGECYICGDLFLYGSASKSICHEGSCCVHCSNFSLSHVGEFCPLEVVNGRSANG